MTEHGTTLPQFYMTAPSDCPYLEGRVERKLFTVLTGDHAVNLNNTLTKGGFRRSQNIIYQPACEGCDACISVRIPVDVFRFSGSFRRVLRKNRDMAVHVRPPGPTSEQYSLFRDYIEARHHDGGMAEMSVFDYMAMVGDTGIDTHITEYRPRILPGQPGTPNPPLLAAALTDVLDDGLSLVYSFFSPREQARSLGTYMILDHIRQARTMGLPYVYLGYWVKHSQKMQYKARFHPQERLGPLGWERVYGPD